MANTILRSCDCCHEDFFGDDNLPEFLCKQCDEYEQKQKEWYVTAVSHVNPLRFQLNRILEHLEQRQHHVSCRLIPIEVPSDVISEARAVLEQAESFFCKGRKSK